MQSFLFSRNFDTTLMPLCRNLSLRNGVYYYRQQINGKRIFRSLHTSDPYTAVFLLRQILANSLSSEPSVPVIIQSHVQNQHNTANNKPRKTKHDILEVWDSLPHQCITDQAWRKNRAYILKDVQFLECKYIEDLADNPELIYNMLDKFRNNPIKQGGHKGQTLSLNSLKRYIMMLRQVINHAADMDWIDNKDKLISKLQLRKIKGFESSVRREPLAEPDFEKLFRCIYGLLHNDTSMLDTPCCELSSEERSRIKHIKKYPKQIAYVILLCLWGGLRACAAETVRVFNIDLCNKTISIRRDETLIKNGDKREKYKQLKTIDSERKIPIADILDKLGFCDYIMQQQRIYGDQAFIFEECIKNKTNRGYRPKTMSYCVNTLFKIIGIKPQNNDTYMLDMHSLKESFYSHNEQNVSRDMLEAIAGQKPSNKSISSRVYNKQSFTRLPTKMIEAVNSLSYPHMEILFGK